MGSSTTLAGFVTLITMLLVGLGSYQLSKDKSKTPKMIGLIGVILSAVPPLGVIYLIAIALMMKSKHKKRQDN